MRPKDIASYLEMPVREVYRCSKALDLNLSELKPSKLGRPAYPLDADLTRAINSYFIEKGLTGMKLASLKRHIDAICGTRAPSVSTLRRLLHRDYCLAYRPAPPSKVGYSDPSFNEKRLWVSRILAQLVLDDVLVVSVDESSFRANNISGKEWQLNRGALFHRFPPSGTLYNQNNSQSRNSPRTLSPVHSASFEESKALSRSKSSEGGEELFQTLKFHASPRDQVRPVSLQKKIGLTPVMEDLAELLLTS